MVLPRQHTSHPLGSIQTILDIVHVPRDFDIKPCVQLALKLLCNDQKLNSLSLLHQDIRSTGLQYSLLVDALACYTAGQWNVPRSLMQLASRYIGVLQLASRCTATVHGWQYRCTSLLQLLIQCVTYNCFMRSQLGNTLDYYCLSVNWFASPGRMLLQKVDYPCQMHQFATAMQRHSLGTHLLGEVIGQQMRHHSVSAVCMLQLVYRYTGLMQPAS